MLRVFSCARAIASGLPLATLHPRDAVTLPLAAIFILLAAMSILPDPQLRLRPSRRSPAARRSDRIAAALFAAATLAALTVPFASPIASLVFGWSASRRGYAACPQLGDDRYATLRWAREPQACPTAGPSRKGIEAVGS